MQHLQLLQQRLPQSRRQHKQQQQGKYLGHLRRLQQLQVQELAKGRRGLPLLQDMSAQPLRQHSSSHKSSSSSRLTSQARPNKHLIASSSCQHNSNRRRQRRSVLAHMQLQQRQRQHMQPKQQLLAQLKPRAKKHQPLQLQEAGPLMSAVWPQLPTQPQAAVVLQPSPTAVAGLAPSHQPLVTQGRAKESTANPASLALLQVPQLVLQMQALGLQEQLKLGTSEPRFVVVRHGDLERQWLLTACSSTGLGQRCLAIVSACRLADRW